jgi:hypothetical protein
MAATIASAKFKAHALQGLVSQLAADMDALSVELYVEAQQTAEQVILAALTLIPRDVGSQAPTRGPDLLVFVSLSKLVGWQ